MKFSSAIEGLAAGVRFAGGNGVEDDKSFGDGLDDDNRVGDGLDKGNWFGDGLDDGNWFGDSDGLGDGNCGVELLKNHNQNTAALLVRLLTEAIIGLVFSDQTPLFHQFIQQWNITSAWHNSTVWQCNTM